MPAGHVTRAGTGSLAMRRETRPSRSLARASVGERIRPKAYTAELHIRPYAAVYARSRPNVELICRSKDRHGASKAGARWPCQKSGTRRGELTLVIGPGRSSSLKLSATSVYEPRIRAHIGTTAHFCEKVVLNLRAVTIWHSSQFKKSPSGPS